jgi:Thioredoxin
MAPKRFVQTRGGDRLRFVGPYYLGNAALIGTYLVHRFILPGSSLASSVLARSWESVVGVCAVALLVSSQRKKVPSVDGFLGQILTVGRCAVLSLAFLVSWKIGLYYLLAILFLFVLFPQPVYSGRSPVQQLTPAAFHQDILKAGPSDGRWLVEFYAPWSSSCVHFRPVFAGLAWDCTNENLKFGHLEISRWPGLAKSLNIDVGTMSLQLPTVVLFEKGYALSQTPNVDDDGVFERWQGTRGAIMTLFDLQNGTRGIKSRSS